MIFSDRQKSILDATLRVVERDGLGGFTMKKVAAELGVTDAAIYKHFREKTEIFAALAGFFRERTLDSLVGIAATKGLSALEKLEAFVKQRARQFQEDPGLTVVLFSEEFFRGEPGVASLNLDTMERHAELLIHLVREGQQEGTIRPDLPSSHIVLLLTGPMRLLVAGWKSDRNGLPLVERIEEFWKTFETLVRFH